MLLKLIKMQAKVFNYLSISIHFLNLKRGIKIEYFAC